jgi:hypothetical protein
MYLKNQSLIFLYLILISCQQDINVNQNQILDQYQYPLALDQQIDHSISNPQYDSEIQVSRDMQVLTSTDMQVLTFIDMQVLPSIDMQVLPSIDMQVLPSIDMQVSPPVDPCGDPSVIPALQTLFSPVLTPISNHRNHGLDNIYAPDVIRLNEAVCFLYYGAQSLEGHDSIYLATSNDCIHWQNWPRHTSPIPVVDHGDANHVNDPSVVIVNGIWYMYYTVAQEAEDDRIHLSTSNDGITWQKIGLVLDIGPNGTWDSFKVGRPSVIYENGVFWLYYDGNNQLNRHIGLATSMDGIHFQKHPDPLILNAGAVDVEKIGNTFIAVYESHVGTYAQSSANGLQWCEQGLILGLSGQSWEAFGQVTPFIFKDQGIFKGLYFGGASNACWCKNRIGLATSLDFQVGSDPDIGCGLCVANSDCTQACRDGGYGVEGLCAVPGSSEAQSCCACF